MNTFRSTLLVMMSLSYLVCDGALSDCQKCDGPHCWPRQEDFLSYRGEQCAIEGDNEYCQGPGRIYYGGDSSWTYRDVSKGDRIACNNDAFNCDPLFGIRKKCYNSCDMFHECPNTGKVARDTRGYGKGLGPLRKVYLTIDEKIEGCGCDNIRQEISGHLREDKNFKNLANSQYWIDEVWKNMGCRPVLPQPVGACN